MCLTKFKYKVTLPDFVVGTIWASASSLGLKKKKTKMLIKVQGDVSEPNHLRCAKELTAPTDPRQLAWGLN